MKSQKHKYFAMHTTTYCTDCGRVTIVAVCLGCKTGIETGREVVKAEKYYCQDCANEFCDLCGDELACHEMPCKTDDGCNHDPMDVCKKCDLI